MASALAASVDAEMGASTLDDRRPASALGDRGLVARAGLALILANVRYWSSVAPIVRGELRRWERRAKAIEDPELRALALEKLYGEGFHAEAGAMLATLAPRSYRRDAVEAIVALEVLFDYLDGLTERPAAQPIDDRERLYESFVAPFARPPSSPSGGDGYAEDLSQTVTSAFDRLPAAAAVAPQAHAVAQRLGQAQTRMHAAHELGLDQVERWARDQASTTDLGWRELLAGAASSVLVLHALIAAAADTTTTSAGALDIENAYLPMSTLLTLIDGLVDHGRDDDASTGSPLGYIDVYSSSEELSAALITTSDLARSAASRLRPVAHHSMMLFAVVAYYTTAPGAHSEFARPTCERLQERLRPGIGPALLVMRAWRLAKRLRKRNYRRSPVIRGLASSLGKSSGIGGAQ
jgi:tetraprenyl-beta-curcumene synthase